MTMIKRLAWLSPAQLVSSRPDRSAYLKLPTSPGRGRLASPRRLADRLLVIRLPITQLMWTLIFTLTLICVVIGGLARFARGRRKADSLPAPFPWQNYHRLDGYYNGIRTLVSIADFTQENGYNHTPPRSQLPLSSLERLAKLPPLDPIPFDPYPRYNSPQYLQKHPKVLPCYLDEKESVRAPDIYAYPGLPQNMTTPFFSSHETLGMNGSVCFDRFGRFGPYGFGVPDTGESGPETTTEADGAYKIMRHVPDINYTTIDWGSLQKRCQAKNSLRFDISHAQVIKLEPIKRHAYLLRVWQGSDFGERQIYSLRAMINELSLKSSGEYDVVLLVHVKDEALPVFTDSTAREQFIQQNIPREFWNMTELWSEPLMTATYPGPWGESFEDPSGRPIHGVYRSAHMAVQWYSQLHPEYDYYWNWEMDMRYLGHYYELNERLGSWARDQPRKGLWERNERMYIPQYHGSWQNFSKVVALEDKADGRESIWGPVQFNGSQAHNSSFTVRPPTDQDADNYTWGVGEDADLITFNPIFDPDRRKWIFGNDITGYDLNQTIPPRRAAIITISRLSKRLLDIMHHEVRDYRHSAFPEMWPATVSLHYGLKAVYAPHPVYFDRDWDVEYMDQVFNHPVDTLASPWYWGEHNFLGSSFYYNSGFSGALWRRWLGQREQGRGGKREESARSGRMCLRSTLHHPIKFEEGPTD